MEPPIEAAMNGGFAAGHALATAAAENVLRAGGNAYDALISPGSRISPGHRKGTR